MTQLRLGFQRRFSGIPVICYSVVSSLKIFVLTAFWILSPFLQSHVHRPRMRNPLVWFMWLTAVSQQNLEQIRSRVNKIYLTSVKINPAKTKGVKKPPTKHKQMSKKGTNSFRQVCVKLPAQKLAMCLLPMCQTIFFKGCVFSLPASRFNFPVWWKYKMSLYDSRVGNLRSSLV